VKLEYFVLAESVLVDSHTNRVSIFNVLETIEEIDLPSTIPIVTSVAVLHVEDGDDAIEWQGMLEISAPEGKPIAFPANFQIPKGATHHRLLHRLEGLPITTYGNIRFELKLNGQHIAEHRISIVKPVDRG
jgi:hypothetical protein